MDAVKSQAICNNRMDKECHLKNYGVYCCNDSVEIAIGAFAKDVGKTVRRQ